MLPERTGRTCFSAPAIIPYRPARPTCPDWKWQVSMLMAICQKAALRRGTWFARWCKVADSQNIAPPPWRNACRCLKGLAPSKARPCPRRTLPYGALFLFVVFCVWGCCCWCFVVLLVLSFLFFFFFLLF